MEMIIENSTVSASAGQRDIYLKSNMFESKNINIVNNNNNNYNNNNNNNSNNSSPNSSPSHSLTSSPSTTSLSGSEGINRSSPPQSPSSLSGSEGIEKSPLSGSEGISQEDSNRVVEGELVKEGHIFKSWRTRWFRIENGFLLYFKSKDEKEPIDRVPLRGSRVSKKPFHDRPNTFELIAVSMRKIFLLQAKSAKDVDFWMEEIDRASKLARSPSKISL